MPAPAARPGRLVTRLRQPFDDTMAGMQALAALPRPALALAWMAAGLVATWFVYVPLHELLHVAGCVLTGGSVSELQLDPIYGAALLARFLPFVVPGGEYAGRLSGFDTGGSDGVYLATDFAPYLLSVGVGVPLLHRCAPQPRPFLLGAAAVLALAPFYNLAGDYYEMGSILATRVAVVLSGEPGWVDLRSDDLFKLLGELDASALPGSVAAACGIIGSGILLAVALAFLTYAAGSGFSALLRRRG